MVIEPTDVQQMISKLKTVSGCFEVYNVTTLVGYREHKTEGVKKVSIEVRDAGPDEYSRWHVSATDEDGRHASGNPGPSLDTTMTLVHWYELDS